MGSVKESTTFSYSQVNPRGKGELQVLCTLGSEKQTLGADNEVYRSSNYDLGLAFRAAKNVIVGVEVLGESGSSKELNTIVSDSVNPDTFGTLEKDEKRRDLTGFAQFRIPLNRSHIRISLAGTQVRFDNKRNI